MHTNLERGKGQTPILIAAKLGVIEMVGKILEEFPVAIHDEDAEKKNVVLLAVENKRSHVYHLLRNKNIPIDAFRHVDYLGNSAVHLAAAHCEENYPWTFSGSGLHMQWDIKWLKVCINIFKKN